MPTVKFTTALKRFFPDLKDQSAQGKTLPEILREMEVEYPGVCGYLLDDQGHLRQHVNIFINGAMISDRVNLSDSFPDDSEIFIMQALSGG